MGKNLTATEKYIFGNKLTCAVCKHDRFWERETLINTKGMSFFNLDWAKKSAQNLICDKCGYVHWFFKP